MQTVSSLCWHLIYFHFSERTNRMLCARFVRLLAHLIWGNNRECTHWKQSCLPLCVCTRKKWSIFIGVSNTEQKERTILLPLPFLRLDRRIVIIAASTIFIFLCVYRVLFSLRSFNAIRFLFLLQWVENTRAHTHSIRDSKKFQLLTQSINLKWEYRSIADRIALAMASERFSFLRSVFHWIFYQIIIKHYFGIGNKMRSR